MDAYLKGADLEGANLVDANLKGANLEKTDLTGANLVGADLNGARNITIDQLSKVKTLHLADLDPNLEKLLRYMYPALFINPDINLYVSQKIKK